MTQTTNPTPAKTSGHIISREQWTYLLKFVRNQCFFLLLLFGVYEMAKHSKISRDNTFMSIGAICGANVVVVILTLKKMYRMKNK